MDVEELEALREAVASRPDELLRQDPQDPHEPVAIDGFQVANGSLLQLDGFDSRTQQPKYKPVLSGRALQHAPTSRTL